jgi:coenzyme F420-reducing hydrogenase gamma subunit
MRNMFEKGVEWVKKEVYGDYPIETNDMVCAVDEIVKVDLKIYGCPPSKPEMEKIVQMVVMNKPYIYPKYPVCMECKANGNICLYDLGKICLGPITRAGCGAVCANARRGCFGCRGPAEEPNLKQMNEIMLREGFSKEQILERLGIFSGFPNFEEESV